MIVFPAPRRFGRNSRFFVWWCLPRPFASVLSVPVFAKNWFGAIRICDCSARAFTDARRRWYDADG